MEGELAALLNSIGLKVFSLHVVYLSSLSNYFGNGRKDYVR